MPDFLGCDPDEIAILGSATRAWDIIFYGLRFERGDRMLISRTEYVSLREVRGVTVLDRGIERSGIVAFTAQDPGNDEVAGFLSGRGINVRLMPMTVLGRYDHDARGPETLIWASVHYFNDEDEIDRLVAAIRDVVRPS